MNSRAQSPALFISSFIMAAVVMLGLIAIAIYFCLACARANSSQSSKHRAHCHRHAKGQRKPSSAHSSCSIDSIESRDNSSARLAPLTQPNDGELNLKDSIKGTIAQLEKRSLGMKVKLLQVQ